MIKLPQQAHKAIEILNAAGFDAYAVGGIVRNSIMGLDFVLANEFLTLRNGL